MTTAKKMATAALLAELKFRDGVKEQIRVNVQNNLSSLIAAVQELNTSASRLLSELVEQEKSQGDFVQGRCDDTVLHHRGYIPWLFDLPGQPAAGKEDVEDCDDEEDEPEEDVNAELHPPAKRNKT